MVDKKIPEGEAAESGMTQDEQKFLIDCLLYPANGALTIDAVAVAKHRGQANARSVSNRISALKKKYNLNISGSTSVKAQAGEKEDGGVLAPTTPKKIGKKQPRARGKTPVKKSKAKAAADEDDGEVEDNNDSAEDIKPEVEENDDEA